MTSTGRNVSVDPHRECYEGIGESYRGHVNYTEGGLECLFWDHEKVKEVVRPSDYEKYGLQENYCRNPFSDSRPLCFVNPDDSEHSFYWDFCPIPDCNPTTTLATTTPTRTSRPSTAKRHVTPQLPRALSTTASSGPSPAGTTVSLQPGHTHARPSSRVSRITQVTPHSGGLLQKSTEKSAVEACRLDQFECGSDKRCISRQSVCDNLVDCSDRSDEEDCAFRCAADEFFCDDLCYPTFFMCDGWDDCEDGSDEDQANCLTTSQPLADGGVDSGDQGGDSNEQSQNIGDSENGDGLTGGRENDQNSSGINGDGDSASHSGTNGTNEYQNDTRYEGNNGTNLQDGGSHGNNSDLHGSGRGNGSQGNGGQGNGGQGNGGQGNGGQGNGGQGNGGQGNGQQGHGGGIYDGDGKGIHNLSDYEELWLRFNLTVKNATRLPCPCFVFGRQLVGRSSASFVNVTVVFHFVVTIVMMRLTSHILE
ncbi:uncharacterized protein LOC144926816 [Branchiostoma floridae x Branchiostoma belcheri]